MKIIFIRGIEMQIVGSILILLVIGVLMTDYSNTIKNSSLIFGPIGLAILRRERRKKDQ
jgi:hypothetical protein